MNERGLWVSNGILMNHESPRRGIEFLTSKVAYHAANKLKVKLGNLHGVRDWGYAPDYTWGMKQILEHDKPDNFVLATGVAHSVEEYVRKAYEYMDEDWEDFVEIDPAFMRTIEAGPLVGNYAKARLELGWKPSVDFDQLVGIMVQHYLDLSGVHKPQ
jgi:GDPmannose 4,6-dehydratase